MAAVERHAAIPKPLSLFASRLSHHRSGDEELRVLEAALSAGADVPALLATRSAARRLLRARVAEALVAAGPVEDDGRRIAIANFFARAFALVGDVEAFANALAHVHSNRPGHLDSISSIEGKDNINDITGLQNLAKSLSAQHSVQAQSAEYIKRRASGVRENCNLQSGKLNLQGSSMFRLGIKTRNINKLLCSRERYLGEDLKQS